MGQEGPGDAPCRATLCHTRRANKVRLLGSRETIAVIPLTLTFHCSIFGNFLTIKIQQSLTAAKSPQNKKEMA